MAFRVPEQYRVTGGPLATSARDGNNGLFFVPLKRRPGSGGGAWRTRCIASDGDLWEHVSVSMEKGIPPWEVMSAIKDLFWSPEDCVMQLHPPHSRYVNFHPHTLHLWRPVGLVIPQPPLYMV